MKSSDAPRSLERRLLAVAFHFPPIQASSGVHRTLAFARYLRDFGWATTVITASLKAYVDVRAENEEMIPPFIDVIRAPALDTVRHLSVSGRYPRWMALPDRWQSWIPGALYAGLQAIRRQKPAAILSTFPIASAHAVGLGLSRLSGLPWIADFRDPMDQITYPSDPAVRKSYRWLESRAFRYAARILVTTPGAADYYRRRYGEELGAKIRVVANGYDEEAFPADFDPADTRSMGPRDRLLTLLHSGILYPKERNPAPFLRALARLRASGNPEFGKVRVVFRASLHEDSYKGLISDLGLQDVVSFPSVLPYREAIAEMLQADALLVFQDEGCNSQIPAKVYEYLYANRPIIGITDPDGDTGRLLRRFMPDRIAKLENEDDIAVVLGQAVSDLRAGTFQVPAREEVMGLSRKARTEELAAILNDLTLARARETPQVFLGSGL